MKIISSLVALTLGLTLGLSGVSHAGKSLTGRCTPELKCDDTWNIAYYYVENFCKAGLNDEQLGEVDSLIAKGELSQWSAEVLLNTYGAMYGYEFKKLKHLNAFFYDANASRWLPPSCVPLMKSNTAKKMPFALTKARDKMRKIYDSHFK